MTHDTFISGIIIYLNILISTILIGSMWDGVTLLLYILKNWLDLMLARSELFLIQGLLEQKYVPGVQ